MKRPSECNETVSAWISAIQPSSMTRRCKPCQTRPSVHCNLLKSTFYDFHWFPPPSPCLFQGRPWTVAPTHPSLFMSFMHAAFSARCLQVNRLVHLPVVSSCHGGHHKRDHIYGAWLTATTKFYVQKIRGDVYKHMHVSAIALLVKDWGHYDHSKNGKVSTCLQLLQNHRIVNKYTVYII